MPYFCLQDKQGKPQSHKTRPRAATAPEQGLFPPSQNHQRWVQSSGQVTGCAWPPGDCGSGRFSDPLVVSLGSSLILPSHFLWVRACPLKLPLVCDLCQSLPDSSDDKEFACNTGDPVQFLGWEDPLEKGKATHSSILAWRIP